MWEFVSIFRNFGQKKMLYPTDLVGYSIKGIFTFPHYHHLSKGSPKRPSQRLQQYRMNIKTFPFRQTFYFLPVVKKKRGASSPQIPSNKLFNFNRLVPQRFIFSRFVLVFQELQLQLFGLLCNPMFTAINTILENQLGSLIA